MSFIDSQLFPCIDYYKMLKENTNIEIVVYDSFLKSSFRNRYVISSANGLIHLTVPVLGGREQKALMKDVEIDWSTNWATKHWRSITSAYKKAPFFDYYADEIRNMLFQNENHLFKYNYSILTKLSNLLNISVSITNCTFYETTTDDLDLRNKILPKNFQDNRQNWQPRYAQVFEDRIGFQPNLSILDLLFCEGPNASRLL